MFHVPKWRIRGVCHPFILRWSSPSVASIVINKIFRAHQYNFITQIYTVRISWGSKLNLTIFTPCASSAPLSVSYRYWFIFSWSIVNRDVMLCGFDVLIGLGLRSPILHRFRTVLSLIPLVSGATEGWKIGCCFLLLSCMKLWFKTDEHLHVFDVEYRPMLQAKKCLFLT